MSAVVRSAVRSPVRSPVAVAASDGASATGNIIAPFLPTGASTDNVLLADFPSDTFASTDTQRTFDGLFTHSRAGNATVVDSDGTLKWAPHNLVAYSEDFSQPEWSKITSGTGSAPTVTANAGTAPDGTETADRIQFDQGAGSTNSDYSLLTQYSSPAAGNSYANGIWLRTDTGVSQFLKLYSPDLVVSEEIEVTANWQFFSLESGPQGSGSGFAYLRIGLRNMGASPTADVLAWGGHLYRSDLGGMTNNPDTGDSYVPTTDAARYLARTQNHIPDGAGGWTGPLCLVEPQATNLVLNSGTLSTQDVTVTAEAHTLHFTGTGTVTLSGVSTDGPLVGTGTGEDNRVSLTFTPTAGTLTLTVSGTVSNAQLETGSVPTSYIPTAGSQVTRAADSLSIDSSLTGNDGASPISVHMKGYMTYADEDVSFQMFFWRLGTSGADPTIQASLRTAGARTGEVFVQQVDTATDGINTPTGPYTPGVHVPFDFASRHTSAEMGLAADGTAVSPVTVTGDDLPDVSAFNYGVATLGVVNIQTFTIAYEDWGDAGLEEITA